MKQEDTMDDVKDDEMRILSRANLPQSMRSENNVIFGTHSKDIQIMYRRNTEI